MCNYLDEDATPIPRKGFGWKMFEIYEGNDALFLGGIICPLSHYRPAGPIKYDGWVNWIDFNTGEDGFCFFLDKLDALDALKSWGPGFRVIIRKIEYRRGLGLNKEWNMFSGQREPINVALAKSFRLVNREGRIGL